MKTTIIKLPTGEAIKASAIMAVRKGKAEDSFSIKERVIIDYSVPDTFDSFYQNSIICECATREERDNLAEDVINEWQDSL